MKRKSSVSFMLVVLFCIQTAFSQYPQMYQENDGRRINNAVLMGNTDFIVSSLQNAVDPRDTTQIFPARGGKVDLGLALSGGGIRSAAFSIGAMKALYDMKILDEVDVISSVSGGGYASYWLFTLYNPSVDKDDFGKTAFDNYNVR